MNNANPLQAAHESRCRLGLSTHPWHSWQARLCLRCTYWGDLITLPSIPCHSSALIWATPTRHIYKSNACSSLVYQNVRFTIYLVLQLASLSCVEISYALVCSHWCNLCFLSAIFCLFQLGSWQELLVQLDGLLSLRQQCYVFLRHATLPNMVALRHHRCVGSHGVSWLFLAAVFGCCFLLVFLAFVLGYCSWLLFLAAGSFSLPWNLSFCCLSPLQFLKTTLLVSSQRLTCISVGTASMLPFVSANAK